MSVPKTLVENVRAALKVEFANDPAVTQMLTGPAEHFSPVILRRTASALRKHVATLMHVAPEAVVAGSPEFLASWADSERARSRHDGFARALHAELGKLERSLGVAAVSRDAATVIEAADRFCSEEEFNRRHAGDDSLPRAVREAARDGLREGRSAALKYIHETDRRIRTSAADRWPVQAPEPEPARGPLEVIAGLFSRRVTVVSSHPVGRPTANGQFYANELLQARQVAVRDYVDSLTERFAGLDRCELLAQRVEAQFATLRAEMAKGNGDRSLPATFDGAVREAPGLASISPLSEL